MNSTSKYKMECMDKQLYSFRRVQALAVIDVKDLKE
jgi:hypothetical protein